MEIKRISVNSLTKMKGSEGLILQGCGGDPAEWVTGINELLSSEGILLDGDSFNDVAVFEHDGLTNLLFIMDDIKLDIGKLAMWRLQSHDAFGGKWLSDYVPNRLGVELTEMETPEEQMKPECPIIGADGNIFNIMGIASRTLKENGMSKEAKEMRSRVMESGEYHNALAIIMEYVEPIETDGHIQGGMEMMM
jgi:hypothetical protein